MAWYIRFNRKTDFGLAAISLFVRTKNIVFQNTLSSRFLQGVGSIGHQISQQGGAKLMLEFLKALRQIGSEVYENNKK